eukprot:9473487-Pyramimonas_sp.AAC.1
MAWRMGELQRKGSASHSDASNIAQSNSQGTAYRADPNHPVHSAPAPEDKLVIDQPAQELAVHHAKSVLGVSLTAQLDIAIRLPMASCAWRIPARVLEGRDPREVQLFQTTVQGRLLENWIERVRLKPAVPLGGHGSRLLDGVVAVGLLNYLLVQHDAHRAVSSTYVILLHVGAALDLIEHVLDELLHQEASALLSGEGDDPPKGGWGNAYRRQSRREPTRPTGPRARTTAYRTPKLHRGPHLRNDT